MPDFLLPDSAPIIVWFREDLRLTDNPALAAAAASGNPVLPLYVWEDDPADPFPPGGAARWWLHHSLRRLSDALGHLGTPLLLRRGDPLRVIVDLAAETGAGAVLWNRRYATAGRVRDTRIKETLRSRGLRAESFNAALLFEPWTVRTKAGQPFRVFTPFWRACLTMPEPPAPTPAPARLTAFPRPLPGSSLADWHLLPTGPDWAGGLRETWQPGEDGARERLAEFLVTTAAGYKADRDRPGVEGTSRLSPYLRWGEIGPRQAWHAARMTAHTHPEAAAGIQAFLRELGWREFCHHLLHHEPGLAHTPMDARFAAFPWRDDEEGLGAWQRGRTGYPIIDAGMRQLWHTGWMHNRVRMVTASFLVKDLLIPWQSGARWFWDTLVDADPADNPANWQWVAGCGADAAPFFRVFNPVLQSETYDPRGAYVRRWVPELAALPDAWIHKPWAAPAKVLAQAGVRLGETYPYPILDHAAARDRALDAFRALPGRD